MPRLVLASGSATRRKMLESVGLEPIVAPARIDEAAIREALMAERATPRDIADALGEMKARKVQEKHPDALVLGSDQVLAVKERSFGKAETVEEAAETLASLQGQTHVLLSSAVLYHEGEPIWRAIGQARMTMHRLSADDIARYLQVAWPSVASSVGCYHAEGYGGRLFSRIDGDWFSVMGMPLLDICSYLRLRGWLTP